MIRAAQSPRRDSRLVTRPERVGDGLAVREPSSTGRPCRHLGDRGLARAADAATVARGGYRQARSPDSSAAEAADQTCEGIMDLSPTTVGLRRTEFGGT